MNVRVSAEEAGWTIREAAWDFEEKVLWRGSDAAQEALGWAGDRLNPLQRLIQTRLTWPLSDAFHAQGTAARRTIASGAAAVALAAATIGAISAPGEENASEPVTAATPIAAVADAGEALVLQGVTPTFAAKKEAPAPAAPPATKPSEPPAQVAWRFAQAFVGYEIGRSSEKTAATFAATATPPLAKALAEDPPRLPADAKVPKARVLNVVLGETTKKEITASVSLVRMRALSEARLTLTRDGDHWRVAQVLG